MPFRPPVYRPDAVKAAAREQRPSAHLRGYDAAWRRLRNRWIAEHPICAICESRGRTSAAVLVDHIVPVVIAPHRRLDETNLRALCSNCHGEVTGRFRNEGINEPRTRRGAIR